MSEPEYNLPQNAYCNFDATSLKSFMVEQLNKEARFTDQNYEGSNLSTILGILSYYTHVLLFYLNQTSSEASFSQASIYENMNRIVKLIEYKPTGKQTSLVPINCVASSALGTGNYVLRKYSYFLLDNIQYTLLKDFAFEKSTTGTENIASISENAILYQGTVGEYPLYDAEGLSYETFAIVVDNLVSDRDTRFISHGTISIYVKEANNGLWREYDEVDSLFLTSTSTRSYELRLNENGHYEVKFGNGVFGRALQPGDQVAAYYILSDGDKGQISKNTINGNKLFVFNSARFNEIYDNINTLSVADQIDATNNALLTFNNPSNSTILEDAESVEDIRTNVPLFLSTQLRLVTENDYERYLKKSIPNIINDIKVVNNQTFIAEYIDYFYRICVDPNKVNRVILNQVNFSDSCDFNNVNIFTVPNFNITEDGQYPDFVSNSFKNLIRDLTNDKKMISNEVVPRDPIYVAFDIGISNLNPSKEVYNDTKLLIIREKNDKTNKEAIKKRVKEVILDFFSPANNKLGQVIDLSVITSSILSLAGVKAIRTTNTKEGVSFNGISFVTWNPMFEGVDVELINQTTTLPFFKFPYFYRPINIINRIDVIDE